MIAVLARSHGSSANNFKEAAAEQGCRSLITKQERESCEAVQGEKNRICNRPTECEPRKQEEDIKELKDKIDRLPKMPEADKENFKRGIRDLHKEIKRRNEASKDGKTIAEGCVNARDSVQKWFEDVAIPLTERMKNAALTVRKEKLERLAKATETRRKTKERLDTAPSDDSARREHEQAVKEYSEAVREVEEFNKLYGPDIEYYADRLIRHYQYEKTNHDTPSRQADARLENCKKVMDMSFPDPP
ncbi:MAG: hypothetical protein KF773_32915 [Deltaproteobacteria bacterium]|nr:hypothetical protein [Deltaproteobacteria bacterium]